MSAEKTVLNCIKFGKERRHITMVSVIIPVYNTERYLEKCVLSVINQTYTDIEIIFVDDGSTDGSLRILEEFRDTDGRIKIISKENEGQGIARNVGIENSGGEYLMFVDADDWIEENCIEFLMNSVEQNSSDISIGRLARTLYGKERTAFTMTECEADTVTDANKTEFLFSISTYPVAKLIKKSLFTENGIKFPKHFFEDAAILPVVLAMAEKISFIDNVVYHYRNHGGSTINNIDYIYDRIYYMDTMISEFERLGIYEKYKDAMREYVSLRCQINLRVVKSLVNGIYMKFLKTQNNYVKEKFGVEEFNAPRVCVFGSYNLMIVSKIFMKMEDAAVVENYYGSESLISCMSKKGPVLGDLFINHSNPFRQKCLVMDLEKRFANLNPGNFADIDYITVDFLEERYDIGNCRGEYFTISEAFTDIAEKTDIEYSVIKSFSDEWFSLWYDSCLRFIERLKKYVRPENIVLVRMVLAEKYYENEEITEFPDIDNIRRINDSLSKCYDFFTEHCPEAKVVDAASMTSYYTDKNFRHGCYPWHLSNGKYTRLSRMLENAVILEK